MFLGQNSLILLVSSSLSATVQRMLTRMRVCCLKLIYFDFKQKELYVYIVLELQNFEVNVSSVEFVWWNESIFVVMQSKTPNEHQNRKRITLRFHKRSISLNVLWLDTGRFALKNTPIWSNLKYGGVTLSSCPFTIKSMPGLQEPKVVGFLVNSVPDMWISLKPIIRRIENRWLLVSCSLGVAPEKAIRWTKERGLSLFPRGSSIGSQAILYHYRLLSEPVSYILQTHENSVGFWPTRGSAPGLVLRTVGIRRIGDALEAEIPPSLQVKGLPLCTVRETCICLQICKLWKRENQATMVLVVFWQGYPHW